MNNTVASLCYEPLYKKLRDAAKTKMRNSKLGLVDLSNWRIESVAVRVAPSPFERDLGLPPQPSGATMITVDCTVDGGKSKANKATAFLFTTGEVSFEACVSGHVPLQWKVSQLK
jgi:hypothetical protein